MWTAIIRGAVYLVVLTFLMWLLPQILAPITDIATAGDYGSAQSVVRVNSYFAALTVENLTLIGALAVGIYLLGRAAVERRLG
jgi:hypothetical protein